LGQGYSVNAAKLRAGSEDVNGLQGRCELIGGDAADTLSGLAGSAGHPGLAAALSGAAGQGFKTFFAMRAAYGHVSASLAASAANYAGADRATAAKAGWIFKDLR
jgi:hypothetical protein